jgi:hypothetical protein
MRTETLDQYAVCEESRVARWALLGIGMLCMNRGWPWANFIRPALRSLRPRSDSDTKEDCEDEGTCLWRTPISVNMLHSVPDNLALGRVVASRAGGNSRAQPYRLPDVLPAVGQTRLIYCP